MPCRHSRGLGVCICRHDGTGRLIVALAPAGRPVIAALVVPSPQPPPGARGCGRVHARPGSAAPSLTPPSRYVNHTPSPLRSRGPEPGPGPSRLARAERGGAPGGGLCAGLPAHLGLPPGGKPGPALPAGCGAARGGRAVCVPCACVRVCGGGVGGYPLSGNDVPCAIEQDVPTHLPALLCHALLAPPHVTLLPHRPAPSTASRPSSRRARPPAHLPTFV